MADNVDTKTATNVPVATDVVTYSGDADQNVQLIRPVLVTGAEGSKTVVDLTGDGTNGLDVDVTRVSGQVKIGDGTDDVSVVTSAADAASNTANLIESLARLLNYNGTTWDRVRGDTTNGLWVNVKADATTPSAASTVNSTSSDGGTALTSTAQAIKGSAGTLRGYYIYNPNASAVYVQFYNTVSGSVTVGTTNPLFMLTLPPSSAANLWTGNGGVNFSTAMSWAATSTAGGSGAPTTALDAVCWYT